MNKFFIAAAAAAAITTIVATPAIASDHSWKVGNDQYHVYYADLDVNSAAGRAAMLARVEKAAAKLCDGATRADEQACVADALNAMRHKAGGAAITVALAERSEVRSAAR